MILAVGAHWLCTRGLAVSPRLYQALYLFLFHAHICRQSGEKRKAGGGLNGGWQQQQSNHTEEMPPTPGPLITVIRTPRPSQHCRKHHWHFNGHFLLLFLNNACAACQHCFTPPLVCLCSVPLCRNYNGDLCLLCCLLHKLHSSHTWGRLRAVHHTLGDVCVWAHMHVFLFVKAAHWHRAN